MHESLSNINDQIIKKSLQFRPTFSARPRLTILSGLDCASHRSPKTSRKAGFCAASAVPLAEVISMVSSMQQKGIGKSAKYKTYDATKPQLNIGRRFFT